MIMVDGLFDTFLDSVFEFSTEYFYIRAHEGHWSIILFVNFCVHTLNLIGERVENSLECIGTGDNFLNRTPIL